ncbi:MAG TPA: nuclear transport factor 2 family protein [Actinophytocola sp.]|nr:nuclear transport factor 2 family protein [Actinophytocola sp.]
MTTQSEIKSLLDGRSEAIWTKDLERLMSFYAADVSYFDIVPPLRYDGADALRERFRNWFDGFDGPIGQELRELNVVAGGEIAVATMLIRASGTLTNGREVGHWVRATSCCQRSNQLWLITHEHVSLPADPATGRVVVDLVP